MSKEKIVINHYLLTHTVALHLMLICLVGDRNLSSAFLLATVVSKLTYLDSLF